MKTTKIILSLLSIVLLASCAREEGDRYYQLSNKNGMSVTITNYGGRVVSVVVPDRDGVLRDVALGFDNVEEYYPENHSSSFGAAIGRYANRIGGAKFTLDGKTYELPVNNNGLHCMHCGPTGFQYRSYLVVEADKKHLRLRMDSPDGDNNFPGAVTAFVTYTLTDDNKLDISYEAVTTAPTVINMTNHTFFNLAGDPEGYSVRNDILRVNASHYTPVDETFIPTGEIAPVAGTPMDFTTAHAVGDRIDEMDFDQIRWGNGYDHNWVLDTGGRIDVPAAEIYCPQSGITMTVYTNEPGLQVYTGNSLDGSVKGKGGVVYGKQSAICLESQHFPDSPNKPQFPSTVLRPGETFRSRCIYAFGVR